MEVWIGRGGERHGPYPEDQVRQWLRSGEVSRNDLGWYDGLADWQPLSVLFADVVTPATPPPFATSRSSTPYYAAVPTVSYAGFWKRVAAYILDAIVLYIPFLLIGMPMGMTKANEDLQQQLLASGTDIQAALLAYHHFYVDQWPYFLLTTVATWLYFAFCESSRWQATIGKLALSIRVTDMNGARISFPRALGRYAGKILSGFILLIGFLMVAFTQRKQGLHDMIVNTLVVNGRAAEQANVSTPGNRNDGSSFSA